MRLTALSCGSPATGESSGGSGLSITDTVIDAVTSRSLDLVPSCTVTSTVFVEAPTSDATAMVMFPEASHPAMVSLAASSALQLMTVSEESGNGLYAPVSTFTASLAPALIFNVLLPDACQRTGRRHYAHGHTGIHGARAVCDLHGNGRGGAGAASLGCRKPASYRNGTGLR